MLEVAQQNEDPQIDWIGLEDKRAALRLALESGAERVGINNLSQWLKQDPSTIRNQLAHRERKTPSAELEHLVWLLDRTYRDQKAGQTGETLLRRADLSEGEAIRLIFAKAQASWDRRALAEVADIIGRIK